MKFRNLFRNRVLAFALAFAMVFTATPFGTPFQPVAAQAAGAEQQGSLAENVQDGAILHCWCWSFNTIKENIPAIAAAGFTSIQTSPANAINDSHPNMKIMGNDTTGGTDGCWWWHYQPTDWKIGNYQLGTRDEFKAMCEVADAYGVNVIVDVVPNHTTPTLDMVSKDLFAAAGNYNNSDLEHAELYHENGFKTITDWSNRLQATTYGMMAPDVDTENPGFQAYFLNYLNDLIDCGADGFRYDTAKHIGVPSDPMDPKSQRKGESNNFWRVVTGKDSANGVMIKDVDRLFQYGEVLQDNGVPEAEYASYLRMTGSSFGYVLRDAIKNNNLNSGSMMNLLHATPDRLVTWVESHDTYCNEGQSVDLTDTQIRLAWAVIAARANGTPLFFSRPDGSNGWNNRWGNNVIGAKGNDEFMSKEVAEVNFFRNAMAGNSEYMRNPNGNVQILQIDRGADGTCFVNAGQAADLNNVPTTMADGTYTDHVSGRTFTVSGGKISGHLDGQKVAVVYNATTEKMNAALITGKNSFNTAAAQVVLTAKNVTNTTYSTSEGASGSFTDGDVITVGETIKEGESVTVTLKGIGENGEISKIFTFKKVGKNVAYLKLPYGWDAPTCYVYNSSGGSNAEWPGKAMTDLDDGLYCYEVPANLGDPLVIFYGGDNNRRYPADQQPGLTLEGPMIYENGVWKEYNPGTPVDPIDPPTPDWLDKVDGSYDIYFHNEAGWNAPINCYAYNAGGSNAGWPGIQMDSLGDNVYACNLPESWTDAQVLFNAGSGNPQYPGQGQPGLVWTGKSMIYANGEWKEVVIEKPVIKPDVVSSLKDGSTFDDEKTVITLTLKNAASGTYSVDDGPVKEFTDSAEVVIGQGKIANTAVTVKVTATDGTETVEKTFTYNKKFNAAKNGGSVSYTVEETPAVRTPAAQSEALGGKYATNPNNGFGAYKTITGAADFTADTLIAQGVANDDCRIFRGSHEGPVYDSYALYGAWDDTNVYLGWQFTNVTDVVDPAQGFPISDNGKPWNGDIPQVLALNLGTGNAGNGKLDDGGYVWGLKIDYETPIDAMLCFSSKPGNGTPALFKAAADGSFSYDTCVAFAKNGISYQYEDGLFGDGKVIGIKGNGYDGYVPSMLTDASSDWVDFTTLGHDAAVQDTFYTMTIPMTALGITKEHLEENGIGVMHLSTFGEGGIASLPMDMTMLDNATEPYTEDASTSQEKADTDVITVPLARLGAKGSDVPADPKPEQGTMTVNFGADRSAPQEDTTDLTLKAEAKGGQGAYTYEFIVDGKTVQNSANVSYAWDTTGGAHTISVVVTDAEGHSVTVTKDYPIEGEEIPVNVPEITSLTASTPDKAVLGTTIKFTAAAEGGEGDLLYKFYRVQNGKTTVFRDFAKSNVAYCNPSAGGDYIISVEVKDEAGNTATESMPYTWEKPAVAGLTLKNIAASAVSPQPLGTTVKFTASAEGGQGALQYRFYRVQNGVTTVFRDFDKSNVAYCNPPKGGDYTVWAEVKDEDGNTAKKEIEYRWDAPVKNLKVTNLSASAASGQPLGTTVKFTASAEGGQGVLQYRFYRVQNGVTTVFRDFDKSNVAYCNPPKGGSYAVWVEVKDADGNTAKKEIGFKWENAGEQLSIKAFQASQASPASQGITVKFTVTAKGGEGDLQYRFYRVMDGTTTVFRDYASSNVAYCNPPKAGSYTIYVDVKDSTGKVVTEQMNYDWK